MATTPWSEKQRRASRASFEHGLMPWEEIARRLGVSRNAVWASCKRAEQKIAAALTGHPIPPSRGTQRKYRRLAESEVR